MQRTRIVGREKNHAIAIPCSAASVRRIAKRLWRATGSIDFLELASREESDEPAVGGPERISNSISTSQRLSRNRIEWTHPEQLLSIRAAGYKGEPQSVR